jgi:hypothetical protein
MEPSPAPEQPDVIANRSAARTENGRDVLNEPTGDNVASDPGMKGNIIPSSSVVSENTMESYVPSSAPPSAEELAAYIGPKAGRYMRQFERFTRTGTTRFEWTWNNPAAFVGLWWYLYRKMYGWALVDFVLSILLGWTLFVPILWGVARAVTADYLYFRQADRRIREARPISSSVDASAANALHLARLAADGGVNRWVTWFGIALAIVILAILLFAFGWIRDAIPPLRELWPASRGHWT